MRNDNDFPDIIIYWQQFSQQFFWSVRAVLVYSVEALLSKLQKR